MPKPLVIDLEDVAGRAVGVASCSDGGGRSDICRATMLSPSPSRPWQVAQVMS